MKKLIIALGALAIANFSFILPVKAQLVDVATMAEARDYFSSTQRMNRDITIGYEFKDVVLFLAAESCKYRDFDRALSILREKFYNPFVVTVLSFDTFEKSLLAKDAVKEYTNILCPEVKDIKF